MLDIRTGSHFRDAAQMDANGRQMTRRDFIGGGLAAASSVALAGPANASLRRGLGARIAAMSGGGDASATVHDYIGFDSGDMILMWDGIDNDGIGSHSDTTTTWKDLRGYRNMTLTMGGGGWTDRSLRLAKEPRTTGTYPYISGFKFLEIVMREIDGDFLYGRHILFSFSGTYGKEFVIIMNKYNGGDYGIVLNTDDRAGAPEQHGLHPLTSWANESFHFAAAYGDDGYAINQEMYYNGSQETPTGGYIGAAGNMGLHRYGSYQANCELYSVRLYSRKLTQAEVRHNYQVDKIRFGI